MAEKRRGLGRGLGALISGSPTAGDAVEAEQGETPGSSPSLGSSDATSGAAPSSEGKQPTTTGVPRETDGASSTSGVPRETDGASSTSGVPREAGEGPPKVKASQASRKSSAPNGASNASNGRKSSADTDESDIEKSSPTRVREQERKSRPVDMFFAPGRAESDLPDAKGDDSIAKRPSTNSRNRRVAVPDVLAQVMQQKDDKGAKVSSSPEASVQNIEPPTSASTYTASTSEDVPRETLVAVPGATFAEITVGDIHPNRKQPRNAFDEEDMAELVHSIREVGLLQPIVVRPSDEESSEPYELVMGERRWRAVQAAGLATIPAIIRKTADTDLLRDALLENLHRSQLNPLEEAAAYQQLLQEFDCTQDELSERIGRSRPQISNTIRLMKLPALVQRRVAAGVLSAGHARALLGLVDTAEMERLAQRIVNEGLSVRATEEIVAMNDGLRRPGREKAPRAAARHERLDYLANSLSDQLDTSVKITLGAKKGRVSIEFGSVDDLNRIMSVISPTSGK